MGEYPGSRCGTLPSALVKQGLRWHHQAGGHTPAVPGGILSRGCLVLPIASTQ